MSHRPIINPITGNFLFGTVPCIPSLGTPRADIHLLVGKHWGPNRGFGAKHIWAEHRSEMRQAGLVSEKEVKNYVAQIVRSGIPLFYEGASFKNFRLLAVNMTDGTAILEFRNRDQEPIWSVVTAYSRKNRHGTLVGTVL